MLPIWPSNNQEPAYPPAVEKEYEMAAMTDHKSQYCQRPDIIKRFTWPGPVGLQHTTHDVKFFVINLGFSSDCKSRPGLKVLEMK